MGHSRWYFHLCIVVSTFSRGPWFTFVFWVGFVLLVFWVGFVLLVLWVGFVLLVLWVGFMLLVLWVGFVLLVLWVGFVLLVFLSGVRIARFFEWGSCYSFFSFSVLCVCFCCCLFGWVFFSFCVLHPMLSVLGCPFWIATSVFANVYMYTSTCIINPW